MVDRKRDAAATTKKSERSSAEKTLSILMALGELGLKSRGGVRLVNLVSATGLPQPTTHRLLADLKRSGFAAQDANGLYRLGPKVLLLSAQCLGGFDLRREAHVHMQRFAEAVGHTVHLGIRDGTSVAYVDKIEPSHGPHVGSTIGERRPMTATALGKALLAFADQTVVDMAMAAGLELVTAKTIGDTAQFMVELDGVRLRGYAIDDEESSPGIRCAAAPVFDGAGLVVAAISISTLVSQVSLEDLGSLGGRISAIAKTISQALRGAPTARFPPAA